MAVTASISRTGGHSVDRNTFSEFCTATLSGTYAAGGFTVNPFTIVGEKGSSPLPSTTVKTVEWYSPTGYIYVSSVSGQTMTTKIFSAPGTELGAVSVPDATVSVVIRKSKI